MFRFFFLVSGFFLQRKIYDFNKIRKYVVRLFQLYIIYTILYIPQIIYIYIEAGGSLIHNLLGFVKNFFFVGTYGQLWYFVGLIVATVLLYLFKNTLKLRDRYLIVVVLILYVVGTIGNAYIQPLKDYINMPVGALAQLDKKYLLLWLYFQVFKTTRNGIFFGFPYVFFGYLIAKNKEKVYRKNYLPFAIVSFLFMNVEAAIVRNIVGETDNDMLFTLLPTSIFVFLFIAFIDCKNTEKNIRIGKYFRCLSVLYFGFHMFISFYLIHFMRRVFGIELHSLLKFILVIVLNYLIAKMIISMSYKDHFRWLKRLY